MSSQSLITDLLLASCLATGVFYSHNSLARTVPVHGVQLQQSEEIQIEQAQRQPVDLVIALDVSGSMSGLINSARQRLWDIVNELGQANPQPDLRIAILSFGNPGYGADTGFVRIDQPFTNDLDAVSKTLFGFGTNGGDEYVARVVDTALDQLAWRTAENGLRIVYVAGNEGAEQDPKLNLAEVMAKAANQDVAVNTLYCGSDNDSDAMGWRNAVANHQGMYASIDQNAAAVATVATPYDEKLASLNDKLNASYLHFRSQTEARDNMLDQDTNAQAMSPQAAASRVAAKSSAVYNNASWELIDALESGQQLGEISEAELPEPVAELAPEDREDYVNEKIAERSEIKAEISQLSIQRQQFIQKERSRLADQGAGLDAAMLDQLKKLAEQKGFSFKPPAATED